MKSLLALCALLLWVIPAQADSIIRMVGTPTWKVTPPVCRFKVDGPIQNLSPAGTASGTLKLVLFVSKTPYPATGTPVSEHILGSLSGMTQFDRAAGKELAKVPKITGDYYFSVLVAEYTFSGWRVRDYADTGKYKLKNGVFVTGTKWRIPSGSVLPPPDRMVNGDHIVFKEKATENLDMISPSSQSRTMVEFLKHKNCRVTEAGERVKVKYAYKTSVVMKDGLISDVGKLTVDFSSLTDSPYQTESQYVLYYLTDLSGYYKRTDLAGTGRRVVWGVFSLNGGAFPEASVAKAAESATGGSSVSSGVDSKLATTDPVEAASWVNSLETNVDRSVVGGLFGDSTLFDVESSETGEDAGSSRRTREGESDFSGI